jgi:hypothetical protein
MRLGSRSIGRERRVIDGALTDETVAGRRGSNPAEMRRRVSEFSDMEIVTKPKMFHLSSFALSVLVLVLANAYAFESTMAQTRPHSCKAANRQVDRKVIQADIEKYRRRETPTIESAYELINCTEAFPLLQKYALDPDPEVRGLITDYVGRFSSPERLQVLVRQIEAYPLKNAGMRYAYQYPCRSFSQIRQQSLGAALFSRIKDDYGDVHRNEIYLLGCLAPRDRQARAFLAELRGSSFPTKLDEGLRAYQLFQVNLALAEVKQPDAIRDALARIDGEAKSERYDQLKSLVEQAQETSNIAILRRLSEFIRDKRTGPSAYGDIRIGDVAAEVFTRKLGAAVTGEKVTGDTRRHTDEELEAIYRRVKSYLLSRSARVK